MDCEPFAGIPIHEFHQPYPPRRTCRRCRSRRSRAASGGTSSVVRRIDSLNDRLQRLEDLYARDLATAVGEVPRHCDHGTADVAEVPVWESARRVLERVEQQLARSRPNQRVSKLRDGLVLLADLLRERPGAHARFFDGRGMTMRLPEIAVLFEASDGGDDDLWLVPVRCI